MIKTIAGTARISTVVIKDGSVTGRDAYCRKLENKFFNKIEKYKRSQFDYIGKNINKILPTKLIKIEKLPPDKNIYNGFVSLATEIKKTIPADVVGYFVAFKTGAKNPNFGGVSIEILMHEMHHLFNYFTHPKIPNRIYKVSKMSSDNNFEKIFTEHFQSPMFPSKCKIAIEELLKNSKDHKIGILQYFRYKLIDEIGAYRSGEEYEHLFDAKHSNKPEEYFESMVQTLFLREKLAIVTDMLKTALKTERETIRCSKTRP